MTRQQQLGPWGEPVYPNGLGADFGGDLSDISTWYAQRTVRRFPTMLALSQATTMQDGYLARVDTLSGGTFIYLNNIWQMVQPATVATTAARDAAFSGGTRGLVQGDRVYNAQTGQYETYYGLYNAATNPRGLYTAGWLADTATATLGTVGIYNNSGGIQAWSPRWSLNADDQNTPDGWWSDAGALVGGGDASSVIKLLPGRYSLFYRVGFGAQAGNDARNIALLTVRRDPSVSSASTELIRATAANDDSGMASNLLTLSKEAYLWAGIIKQTTVTNTTARLTLALQRHS